MRKQKILFTSTVILLLISALTPSVAASDSTPQLACKSTNSQSNVGQLVVAASIQHLPSVEWGIRQGCFKKYGLTIKTAPVATFPIGMAGLISKSYDIYGTTPLNFLKSIADGTFKGKIVGSKFGFTQAELDRVGQEPLWPGELLMGTALIVKKESTIKGYKDLIGKKVAVLSFQGNDHAGILLAFRELGIRNPKIEFLAMSNTQMADALKNGDVDAVVPADPIASQIIRDTGRLVAYPGIYIQEVGTAYVFITSDSISKDKTAEIRAFQKANLEINRLLNKSENEASYRQTISEITKVNQAVADKIRIPVFSEENMTIAQLAYIPSKMKKVGFFKGRFDLGPVLFR